MMTPRDIARRRLLNQRIISSDATSPSTVVSTLGAMQAQDYLGALWAVGLRMPGSTEADIERSLADRTIIRTWPMRGTLHFVAASDVRWLLELLTPRVATRGAPRHRQLELDEATFARSASLIGAALEGGKQLSRTAVYDLLESGGISTTGQRGIHILGRLAHDGLICFGARDGKQQTFALLADWAPNAKHLERDEALAELATRYFGGHGPATLPDFARWSGLKISDARAGLELAKSQLTSETIGAAEYWMARTMPAWPDLPPTAHLLPAFDEFLVGYKDRDAVLDPQQAQAVTLGSNGMFNPVIVIDGRVVGTWRRTIKRDVVEISASSFTALSDSEQEWVQVAAMRYGRFLAVSEVRYVGVYSN